MTPIATPHELLTFWGLKPGMTVVEVDPGVRGWWTEILAPYARATGGAYIAALPDRAQSGAAAESPDAVHGYYIRVAPESPSTGGPDVHGLVQVRNHEVGSGSVPADELISTDAIALVRFGLRAPEDPRVLGTIAVIDRLLKAELPQGPGWRRYNLDGYGEKADGRPFDGVGIGRVWPLLAGERAHYALAAGKRKEAEALLATIEAQTSIGGLIPEQVWDAAPIPDRELAPGRPTGSAMPLVWAHGEYVKLLRSLADGRVFDMSPHTMRRYLGKKRTAAAARGARIARRPTFSLGRRCGSIYPTSRSSATRATIGRPRPTSRRARRAFACM